MDKRRLIEGGRKMEEEKVYQVTGTNTKGKRPGFGFLWEQEVKGVAVKGEDQKTGFPSFQNDRKGMKV